MRYLVTRGTRRRWWWGSELQEDRAGHLPESQEEHGRPLTVHRKMWVEIILRLSRQCSETPGLTRLP